MYYKNKIPILFNIHVEPDERCIPYKKKRWYGYENLHEFMNLKRSELQKATHQEVKFNWLIRLDHQIKYVYGSSNWPLKEYASLIEESQSAGDSFGVHLHSWRPKNNFFRKTWVADFSDPAWIEACINSAHRCFVDHFQRNPTYFSFGDHYTSDETLKQLNSLGFKCDISMYPGRPSIKRIVGNELSSGWLPSHESTPRAPFKLPDMPNFWEIPVSVASVKKDNQDYPEKLLLGIPFERIPEIINDNLSLPNPYLLSETRTDVRLDKYNRIQFDSAINYLIDHPSATKMLYSSVDEFLLHIETAEPI